MLSLFDDRIAVLPDAAKTEAPGTKRRLIEEDEKKPRHGQVVAVGPGRIIGNEGYRVVSSVRVDDRVIYPASGGTILEHEGRTLCILREYEIIAVTNRALPAVRIEHRADTAQATVAKHAKALMDETPHSREDEMSDADLAHAVLKPHTVHPYSH